MSDIKTTDALEEALGDLWSNTRDLTMAEACSTIRDWYEEWVMPEIAKLEESGDL